MSPRAAWRLESLGFTAVYDYVAGKVDWAAAGLPTEGSLADRPRLTDIARADVPRIRIDEELAAVRSRFGDFDLAAVVDDNDVVLGTVSAKDVTTNASGAVADVMQEGPATFRPNVEVAGFGERMDKRGLSRALVTRSDGTLLGLVRRDDVAEEGG